MGSDIEDDIDENIRNAKNKIEDAVDSTVDKLKRYTEESVGWTTSEEEVTRNFKDRLHSLESRDVPHVLRDLCDVIRIRSKKALENFVGDVYDIMQRYLPEVETDDVLKSIKMSLDGFDETIKISNNIKIEIKGVVDNILYGNLGFINGMMHKKKLQELCYECIGKLQNIDASMYLSKIKTQKDEIIDMAKKPILDELLLPMQEQLNEILSDVNTKDAKLQKAQNDAYLLKEKLNSLKQKAEIIKKKKMELGL